MATNDTGVTIAPYFKIQNGQTAAFKKLSERFVATSEREAGCLYYGFCFDGDLAHCREGYRDAEALLIHLQSVAPIIEEALKISELMRVEVHGAEPELKKLRGPLSILPVQFFVLEYGFRC